MDMKKFLLLFGDESGSGIDGELHVAEQNWEDVTTNWEDADGDWEG